MNVWEEIERSPWQVGAFPGLRTTFTADASALGLALSEEPVRSADEGISYPCPSCERPLRLFVAGQLWEPPAEWCNTCHCGGFVFILNQ